MNKKELVLAIKEAYKENGVKFTESLLKNGNKPKTNKELEDLLEELKNSTPQEAVSADLSDSTELVSDKVKEPLDEPEHEAIEAQVDDGLDSFFDGGVEDGFESKFKDEDRIKVMSGVSGRLVHRSEFGQGTIEYSDFGQIRSFQYQELVKIQNLNPGNFENGVLVILNKDLIKEFGLTKLYEGILTPKKLKDIASMKLDEFKELMVLAPSDMRVAILDMVRTLYKHDRLDSLKIKEYVEEEFDVSLDDNQPIKNIDLVTFQK